MMSIHRSCKYQKIGGPGSRYHKKISPRRSVPLALLSVSGRMLTYADVSQDDIDVQIGSTRSIVGGVHILVIEIHLFFFCPNVCACRVPALDTEAYSCCCISCAISTTIGGGSRYDDECLCMLTYADIC